MSEVLMEVPEIAAAAVLLLCGWMAHIEMPKVFSPPQFRFEGLGPQGLLDSARTLAGISKPVDVTVEVQGDEAALCVRTSVAAGGRTRRGPTLPPDVRLPPNAVVLVYGGNVRLRVPAAAFALIAREYAIDWPWVGAGGPAGDPPHVVQYLAPSDRVGVAWFLQLGASRGDHSSSPVWLAADPPVA